MEAFIKTVSLKETPTHYLIEVDRATVEDGPTLLQRDGEPVAVIVSVEEYQAFQKWQAVRLRPAYSLSPDFEAEVAAFEQLKPALLERYPGRAVAIYRGEMVEVGNDKMEVLARVWERFGDVHCYVEWVEPDSPRRARVPSVWVNHR